MAGLIHIFKSNLSNSADFLFQKTSRSSFSQLFKIATITHKIFKTNCSFHVK